MSADPRTSLSPGDPAPWFQVASTSTPRYVFDTVAGRYVVMAFLGSAATPEAQPALAAVEARRPLFDNDRVYDGGELIFPEFGPRRYKAPTGGAEVFGCGLLHTGAAPAA